MVKFVRIDETIRYNLDFIYKTEIIEAKVKVNEKAFSLGGARKVWYVRFFSSISDKDTWESEYFNSPDEANTWLDEFISRYKS